ncbi:MAG: HAD family phosphatase [Candidatus Woesearchaeota archaeon]|nr:HAD family phosphatase [Candidatus Woesearchaeota archaeon]
MKHAINTVIFDWGGVLIDDPTHAFISYCAEKLGVSEKDLYREHMKIEPLVQSGKMKEKEHWKRICRRLNVPKSRIPNASVWYQALSRSYHEKETVSFAKALKKKGYKLGFLSNAESAGVRWFNDHRKNYSFFDARIFSVDVKTVKPKKKIYQMMLKRLKARPEESVFIDDRIRNVKGGEDAGIRSILFKSSSQLKKDLKKLGVF